MNERESFICFIWQMRTVNLNTIDDDFVSFTPMDLSFSPDMKTVLVSTGR